jgi:SAM-dependent methyltransferase
MHQSNVQEEGLPGVPGSNNQDFRTIPSLWPELAERFVLDLGCGSGLYCNEFSRRGAKTVIGIDLNRNALIKMGGQKGLLGSYFVCADAEFLPFRKAVFDVVLSVEVLTHIPPAVRSRVFADVVRVLKNDAFIFFSLHNTFRLQLSRWLRLQKAKDAYPTSNLTVWPLSEEKARSELAIHDLQPFGPVRYLNYHSRFSYTFYLAHPHWSRLLVACEEVLCRIPLLRRLAITFLIVARKTASAPNGGTT